jgi:ABC-type uncharacterized transport system ATPase component
MALLYFPTETYVSEIIIRSFHALKSNFVVLLGSNGAIIIRSFHALKSNFVVLLGSNGAYKQPVILNIKKEKKGRVR